MDQNLPYWSCLDLFSFLLLHDKHLLLFQSKYSHESPSIIVVEAFFVISKAFEDPELVPSLPVEIYLKLLVSDKVNVKGRLSDGIFGPFFQFLRGQNHAILIWP